MNRSQSKPNPITDSTGIIPTPHTGARNSVATMIERTTRSARSALSGPCGRGGCTGGAGVYVELEGKLVGTPHYMSPEQLEGKPADSRSDQFGFSVTCWEMLYGVRPFQGQSLDELLRAIQAQLVQPPPLETELPAAVSEALRRGMRAAPSARYPNMKGLLERLRAAVPGEPRFLE